MFKALRDRSEYLFVVGCSVLHVCVCEILLQICRTIYRGLFIQFRRLALLHLCVTSCIASRFPGAVSTRHIYPAPPQNYPDTLQHTTCTWRCMDMTRISPLSRFVAVYCSAVMMGMFSMITHICPKYIFLPRICLIYIFMHSAELQSGPVSSCGREGGSRLVRLQWFCPSFF